MSIRKIGSSLLALFLLINLVACSSQSDKTIKILSPTGAPALSLLPLYDEKNVEIETVEGSDVLIAELSKKNSEYDMIVAPTNLGTKIYSQAEMYNLEAVLTWGNLYLVGQEESSLDNDVEIAAFGQKAVPELVFSHLFETDKLNVTYYSSVQEASQALLTGKAEVALLAQPIAQATIAKAKKQGTNLAIFADLQELWQFETKSKDKGYPQASLFVKKDANVDYVLDILGNTEISESGLKDMVEKAGVEKLGVPSVDIAVNTYAAQNIRYKKASEVKGQIEEFLKLFKMELPSGCIE